MPIARFTTDAHASRPLQVPPLLWTVGPILTIPLIAAITASEPDGVSSSVATWFDSWAYLLERLVAGAALVGCLIGRWSPRIAAWSALLGPLGLPQAPSLTAAAVSIFWAMVLLIDHAGRHQQRHLLAQLPRRTPLPAELRVPLDQIRTHLSSRRPTRLLVVGSMLLAGAGVGLVWWIDQRNALLVGAAFLLGALSVTRHAWTVRRWDRYLADPRSALLVRARARWDGEDVEIGPIDGPFRPTTSAPSPLLLWPRRADPAEHDDDTSWLDDLDEADDAPVYALAFGSLIPGDPVLLIMADPAGTVAVASTGPLGIPGTASARVAEMFRSIRRTFLPGPEPRDDEPWNRAGPVGDSPRPLMTAPSVVTDRWCSAGALAIAVLAPIAIWWAADLGGPAVGIGSAVIVGATATVRAGSLVTRSQKPVEVGGGLLWLRGFPFDSLIRLDHVRDVHRRRSWLIVDVDLGDGTDDEFAVDLHDYSPHDVDRSEDSIRRSLAWDAAPARVAATFGPVEQRPSAGLAAAVAVALACAVAAVLGSGGSLPL